ncbi:MAG: hypothetical protein ACP5P9_09650 [Acidimicrobiales bacterium]
MTPGREHADDAPRPASRPRSSRSRPSASRATNRPDGRSDFSVKWAIDRLDDREKRFSFAASGGAALFALIIYFSETTNKSFRLAKGQLTPQGTLTVGLIAAALLLVVTFVGRRAPVGFVALFTGAAFGTYLFLGLPFFALAVWLLYRSYKIQRQAATARRTEAGTTGGAGTASGSGPATSTGRGTSTASGRRTAARSGPVANKRFTPKAPRRPPPPPPKLSRRERRQQEATS